MICAFCEELNRRICLGSKLLKKHPKKYTWSCPKPKCKKLLIPIRKSKRTLANGTKTPIIAHFRHHDGESHGGESETHFHVFTKNYLAYTIPAFNDIINIGIPDDHIERIIEDQRPDVFYEMKNNKKIAFELQHSPIKISEFDRRTKGYNEKHIRPSWILDIYGKSVSQVDKRDYDDSTKTRVRTSQLERDIFKTFGRVYYMDVPNREFNPHDDNDDIKIYCAIFDDCRNCDTIKKITIRPISSLEIEFKTKDQLRFARFVSKEMDDELRIRKKRKEELLKKEREQEERLKRQNEIWEKEKREYKERLKRLDEKWEKKEIIKEPYISKQIIKGTSTIPFKPLKELKKIEFELNQIEKNYQTNKSIFIKNRTLFIIGRNKKLGKKIFFVNDFFPRIKVEKEENIDYIVKECKKHIKEVKDEGYRNLGGTKELLTIYVYKTTDVYERKSVYTFDPNIQKTVKKEVISGIRDKFAKTYEANIKFTEVFKRNKLIKDKFYVPEYAFEMNTRTFNISGIEYIMIKETEIDGGELIF